MFQESCAYASIESCHTRLMVPWYVASMDVHAIMMYVLPVALGHYAKQTWTGDICILFEEFVIK
jgi:hypothetical protein